MTTQRDPEETVEMPRPVPKVDEDLEDIDPEQTLVREDWESTVIRRIASRVVAVQSEVQDAQGDAPFGWESEGLRRLSQEVQRATK